MTIGPYRGDGISPGGKRYPYLAAPRLVEVVNMAIALERPLLIKGQPGCGKTRLAEAIAHELGRTLHSWYVKSTSRARDGLYTIDMVRRLQDAAAQRPQAQRLAPYLSFGPLGQAFLAEAPCVLLIDEIDKADIDFPNDLLRELDEKRFSIEELSDADLKDTAPDGGLQREYRARYTPLIVITSNDEKELSDAFLRRCLFHYIDFPNPVQLAEIVRVNLAELDLEETLIGEAVARLQQIRKLPLRKRPSTSELIDWLRILRRLGVSATRLKEIEALDQLPGLGALIKHHRDILDLAPAERGPGA